MAKTTKKTPADIDAYIAGFPAEVQNALQEIRATVHNTVPAATETIKYAMPSFVVEGKGNLVHFAAFKNHIGFYPAPTGEEGFKKQLAGYKTGNGSLQLPLDRPMPISLISKMLTFRLKKMNEAMKKK